MYYSTFVKCLGFSAQFTDILLKPFFAVFHPILIVFSVINSILHTSPFMQPDFFLLRWIFTCFYGNKQRTRREIPAVTKKYHNRSRACCLWGDNSPFFLFVFVVVSTWAFRWLVRRIVIIKDEVCAVVLACLCNVKTPFVRYFYGKLVGAISGPKMVPLFGACPAHHFIRSFLQPAEHLCWFYSIQVLRSNQDACCSLHSSWHILNYTTKLSFRVSVV